MLAIHHPDEALHNPGRVFFNGQFVPHWDATERYALFLKVLQANRHEIAVAPDCGLGAILAVHDPDYVSFLQTAWDRWRAMPNAGEQAIPNVHPTHRMHRKPTTLAGELGWYSNSTSCPIDAATWTAVHASAQVAIHAAERLIAGTRAVYALCRPPGHHAYPDLMTGVCYLNNAAIAANLLAERLGKIAVLDVDVHHGNGTQAMFWTRPDVLFCSIHIDPADGPPYYAGYAEETGEGAGRGLNVNIPLPRGTTDAAYLTNLERPLAAIAAFAPKALVISLGFDASVHESGATFAISNAGFAEIAGRTARLKLPTVLVQEGGYIHPELGELLRIFLSEFEAASG